MGLLRYKDEKTHRYSADRVEKREGAKNAEEAKRERRSQRKTESKSCEMARYIEVQAEQ